MRYFLQLAYNGSPYHGWQRQPGAMTVQQAVEEAIATILRQPVEQTAVTGAGRTDAGVSAACMVAHADLPDRLPDTFLRSVNSLLGRSIEIYSLTPVAEDAHARFDATSRTYHYYAHTQRSPFVGAFSWLAPASLDFQAMNEAAKMLLTTDDFTSFSKLHTDVKTNLCRVSEARWLPLNPYQWCFRITADRFLRNMVRAVVGTLVDVGRGKIDLDGFRRIIEAKDRCVAGTSMPAEPLFLQHIIYPYFTPSENASSAAFSLSGDPTSCQRKGMEGV